MDVGRRDRSPPGALLELLDRFVVAARELGRRAAEQAGGRPPRARLGLERERPLGVVGHAREPVARQRRSDEAHPGLDGRGHRRGGGRGRPRPMLGELVLAGRELGARPRDGQQRGRDKLSVAEQR